MPKITAHVSIWKGSTPVSLAPGDELPDWAVGLVGDHVLDGEPDAVSFASDTSEGDDEAEAGSTDEPEEESADEKAEPEETLEFTKPAARRRRKQG